MKLKEYISKLHSDVERLGLTDERDIVRYVYIDLGRLMNFNVHYTLGNRKEKDRIANKLIGEEEAKESFEKRIGVCRELSMILEMILSDFGFNIETCRSTNVDDNGIQSKHVYNIITLSNGKRYRLDLEEDLEYIQSGAKTFFFGRPEKSTDEPMYTDEELREVDQNRIGYIPEGFYFEDMIWMLKKAVSGRDIALKDKFEFIANSFNKYRDMRSVMYRERSFFHSRVLEETLSEDEYNKIMINNCYKKSQNGEKDFICIISLELKGMEWAYYIYNEEKMTYEPISPAALIKMQKEGLNSRFPIPGLKRYIKKAKNGGLEL